MNLVSIKDLSKEELLNLVERTIYFSSKNKSNSLSDKRVALLFSESSLRTKVAFEIASQMLGGAVVSLSLPNVTKEFDNTPREDILDIVKSLERWVDVIVVRDYTGKSLKILLENSKLPIIDGFCIKDHPTQTIADLSLIKNKFEDIKNLKVCFVGPSKGSAIMESFAYGAVMLGIKLTFLIAAKEYNPKNKDFFEIINKLEEKFCGKLEITDEKNVALNNAKVLYVDEWWENSQNFLKMKMGKLKVDKEFLKEAPEDIKIMHYLPAHHEREISKEVLHSEKSIVFDQAEFRLYSAMASLEFALGVAK